MVGARTHTAGIVLGPRRPCRSRPASARSLIDLMERGFVSAIATNGAAMIHDFEVALVGATSEDVDEALGPGRFGMAEETGRLLNAGDYGRRRRRARHRPGRRDGSWRDRQPQFARSSVLASRRAARDPGDGSRRRSAPTSSTCTRRLRAGARRGQPARLPLLRVQRRAARAGRLPQLRIGGHPARKSSSRRSRWRATAACALAGLTTVNLGFRAAVPAARPTS